MKNRDVCVLLLAGGIGSRMQTTIPKQFLPLKGKSIAQHSFELFMQFSDIREIVVICEEKYRELFSKKNEDILLGFAAPGKRRQDSVLNGFKASQTDAPLICIHDSARPFINHVLLDKVISSSRQCGAALLGVPVKNSIKKRDGDNFVIASPDRNHLYEAQTPQVISRHILEEGFKQIGDATVTDDVSFAELLNCPVKIVEGEESNIKITTPLDLILAEIIADGRIQE